MMKRLWSSTVLLLTVWGSGLIDSVGTSWLSLMSWQQIEHMESGEAPDGESHSD